MKKVVIFCHDRAVSGANFSLLDYLENYDKDEYQVLVILPHKGAEMCKKLEELNISYDVLNLYSVTKSIGNVSIKIKVKKALQIMLNGIQFPFRISRMKKKLNDFMPDYIISNSFTTTYGAFIARQLKLRHIYHVREYMELDHQITHYNKRKIDRLCHDSYAVFISNSVKEYYDEKYRFLDSLVLYDNVREDRSFQKKRSFCEDGIIRLMLAGSLIPNKGQMDAIQAFQKLKNRGINTELLICGKGSDEARLKKYVSDNAIKGVQFLGFVSDLSELRKNIDISLVCSKNEALGRVTVESMYSRCLTIGTNSGETKYLLADGRGLLYHYGIVDELVERIMWTINHQDQISQITEKAFLYAKSKFNQNILSNIIHWVDEHNEKRV